MSEKGKKVFDISTMGVKETTDVDLLAPDGEPLCDPEGNPLSVTIYGPGSKAFQRAQSDKNRAVIAMMNKGAKKMKDGEQREIDAEFLATCTVSFNGFSYGDGGNNVETFRAAYSDPSIGYIAEQVLRAVTNWQNFMKR